MLVLITPTHLIGNCVNISQLSECLLIILFQNYFQISFTSLFQMSGNGWKSPLAKIFAINLVTVFLC